MEPLFEIEPGEEFQSVANGLLSSALSAIDGLTYVREFVTKEEESELLTRLDHVPWSTEMKRRVYSFGSRYGPDGQRVATEPLPDWVQAIAQRLFDRGLFTPMPDRALANEYLPGQGISPHVDYKSDFGDTVASLSLGSDVVMDFARNRESRSVWLERRSVVVLDGVARYEWTHGIARRKSDRVGPFVVPRGRRVSLTFRASLSRSAGDHDDGHRRSRTE